jgi:peptidyl-prolyl cis-trans isomerase C
MQRIRYNARHILLEDLEDALEVIEMLKGSQDFASLACEYSNCPSAGKGGKLGEFYSGSMAAEFERALYKMQENEISGPVATKHGYHIIEKLPLDKD